jgi:hypothetical protein
MWKTFTRVGLASSIGIAATWRGAPPAYAQPRAVNEETARIAFTEGLRLRDVDHDARAALTRFNAAYELAVTPRTAYELGRTYLLLGDWLTAQHLFLEVGRMPPDPLQSPAGKAARDESRALERQLERRIPAIRFELVGASASRPPEVAVDGVVVPPDALSFPWKVNPGTHTVTVRVDGAAERARSIVIVVAEGRTEPVEIDLAQLGTWSAWSPAPPSRGTGPSKAVAFVLGGAGVLLAGGGAALALSAKSTFDAARQNECGGAVGAPTDEQCSAQGLADRRVASARADLATALFGAGLAAVAAGAVVWLAAPSSSDVRVGLAANGVLLRGGF